MENSLFWSSVFYALPFLHFPFYLVRLWNVSNEETQRCLISCSFQGELCCISDSQSYICFCSLSRSLLRKLRELVFYEWVPRACFMPFPYIISFSILLFLWIRSLHSRHFLQYILLVVYISLWKYPSWPSLAALYVLISVLKVIVHGEWCISKWKENGN